MNSPQVEFLVDGHRYRWSGWFGCQLESVEWLSVPAGTTRDLRLHAHLSPVRMTVYSTRREGFSVRTTWAVSSNGPHDEHDARIRDLRKQLQELV